MSLITSSKYEPATGKYKAAFVDDSALAHRAISKLGFVNQNQLMNKMIAAIKDPSGYIADKQKAMGKIADEAGATYTKAFKELVELGISEEDADRLALELAASEYNIKMATLLIQYPDYFDGLSLQHGISKKIGGTMGILGSKFMPKVKVKKEKE